MLALVDGLALHRRIDPGGFRSENVQRALDVLLHGLALDGVAADGMAADGEQALLGHAAGSM